MENMPTSDVVTLDVGSSSVRTLLFDSQGHHREGFGAQFAYHFAITPDGGVEMDAEKLLELVLRSLATIHQQLLDAQIRPAAVGISAFWHGLMGVDRAGKPTTPVLHLFDSRSTAQVSELSKRLDGKQVHARTGCALHSSFWPAKLLWLSEKRPEQFRATDRWISFAEYLFLKLFGSATASTSMVSASGLWNQAANDYDDEILGTLPVDKYHLCPWGEMDQPQSGLRQPYGSHWPLFQGILWYPAWGDGACDSVGSGCTSPDRLAVMVGTTGALRSICEKPEAPIPEGLFCYRLDRSRYVIGGALSNGGDVYEWLRHTLALPDAAETERRLASARPGDHGLVFLPFFAGERSPYWRQDLRAAIAGMNLATKPIDLAAAALESIALRFREVYGLTSQCLGKPATVVASGGALAHSPAWTQMIADAIGLPLTMCLEPEATSRGAALLAFERLGVIQHLAAISPSLGSVYQPRPQFHAIYGDMLDRQARLFQKLFSEN